MTESVKWVKLHDLATFNKSTAGSQGYDLCACIDVPLYIGLGQIEKIPLGIAVSSPGGGLLFIRSGKAASAGLALVNGVGLIDADYTGELCALVMNVTGRAVIRPGERIAQYVPLPSTALVVTEVADIADTTRGQGGFGSTG